MSYEMSKLRKEDISLFLYMKDIVLKDFIEQETSIPLVYSEELSMPTRNSYVYTIDTTMTPIPSSRGRGWVYFDSIDLYCLRNSATYSGTPEQVDRVIVYDANDNTLSDQEYILDYIDCRVITSGTVAPDHIDYYWNYVSVVDEWADVEASDAPVVVIDIKETNKKGYQLGGGKSEHRQADIHIFASSSAERSDLTERIHDALFEKSIPIYELPNGSVLDFDGTFYGRKITMDKSSTLFDRTTLSGVTNLYFDNVISRNVGLPLILHKNQGDVNLSDLNAFRSRISFEMFSYNNNESII